MIKYIITDISALFKYFPLAFIVGIVSILVWYALIRFKDIEFSQFKAIVVFLFYAYCTIALEKVLIDRVPGSHRWNIEWSIFHTTQWANMRAMTVENILLFVPFGLLAPILFKKMRKAYIIIPTVFVISVLIETIQYCTGSGYCQLEDVVMNTTGSIIGYILYLIIKKVICVFKEES